MRKILIVGGGNLGYFLSQALMEDGYSVSLIEKEKEYCRRVANLLDIPVICGDGTMVETLARGGAGKCDTLIAVTGKDEDNLPASLQSSSLTFRRRWRGSITPRIWIS